MNNKKRVSSLSVILLTVGSTVGAGIFFKNETILGNTGSISLSIVSWVIAAFAIFCIGMTLSEIIKHSKSNNSMGTIGWIKTFCSSKIYKGFRNYMGILYLPLTSWFMSYYAYMSLQDAISAFTDYAIQWWGIVLLSFFTAIYFNYSAIACKKIGVIQNNIMVFIKFIPILFAIIGGFILFGIAGKPQNPIWSNQIMDSLSVEPAVLTQYTPLFGVIGSIPAIFFAFDGFYAPSGVYNDLKNKKVFPKALSWGILFTTIIYLLISLGLLFGAKNGTVIGLLDLNTDVGKIISFIVEFCIFVAVLCILNGFALYGGDFYESLVKNNEIPNAIKKRFNLQDRKVMSMVVVGFYIFVFVLATVIGMFYFHNLYDGVKYYDRFTKAIYQFCDIVSNWTSLLIFVGIGLTIFFGLIRKMFSKKIMIYGIIALIIISISCTYEITNSFFNLVSCSIFQAQHNTSENLKDFLIPAILQIVFLIILVCICFGAGSKKLVKKVR